MLREDRGVEGGEGAGGKRIVRGGLEEDEGGGRDEVDVSIKVASDLNDKDLVCSCGPGSVSFLELNSF